MMDHQQGAVTPGGVTEMNKVVGGGAMPTAAMMHSMEYPWLGQMAAFSMPQPTPTSTAAAATLLQVCLYDCVYHPIICSTHSDAAPAPPTTAAAAAAQPQHR